MRQERTEPNYTFVSDANEFLFMHFLSFPLQKHHSSFKNMNFCARKKFQDPEHLIASVFQTLWFPVKEIFSADPKQSLTFSYLLLVKLLFKNTHFNSLKEKLNFSANFRLDRDCLFSGFLKKSLSASTAVHFH